MSDAAPSVRRWSLGTHLTLVVLLALIPALVIQYLSNLERRKDAKVRAQEHLQQLVTQLANQQERVTAATREMLTTLSYLPELRSGDTGAFSRMLMAIRQEDPRLTNIFALDPGGHMIASATPDRTASLGDRPYFKQAVESRRFTIGEYVVGRVTGIPSLHYALPVLDEHGNLLSVLAAAYSLDHYVELFGSPEVPSDTSTIVVDREGTVLYRRSILLPDQGTMVGSKLPGPQLERMLGTAAEGTFWAPLPNGEPTLFAFRQVRLPNQPRPCFSILVGRTESKVLGEGMKADRRNMLLLVVTGLCALVAARAMASWVIASPVRRLVYASRQIGSGLLSERPKLRTTSREVAQLGEELWQANRTLARRDEEQRKTQEVLRNTQRMESLGVLTGGIAHAFNNLLTAVLGNLSLAQLRLEPGDPVQRALGQAERAAQKAAELTRQMLAYSGRNRLTMKPLDLNRSIQEMVPILQVALSKQTTLRLDLAPDLPPILADASQIRQVVLNLVTNASEALSAQEGTVTLRTAAKDLDPLELAAFSLDPGLEAGRFAFLAVSDTGCGMPPEVLQHIFEPFYSTKPMGHGLGLSAIHGILRTHRGGIRIESAPGSGSTFTLLFPATEEALPVLVNEGPESRQTFQGLALVADDEPLVLDFVAVALESMGFEVLRARDGQEAVACFREQAEHIRLAILDFTMPRMNGIEALHELRLLQPSLPVILSSGYDPEAAVRGLVDREEALFLPKPYTMREFHRMVGKAMARAQEPTTPPGPPTPWA